jgi:Tfp pilus assembly PilM family ATPase
MRRAELVLAFDAASIQAASMRWGLGGRRVDAQARRAVSSGALTPVALGTNVHRPEELREAVRAVVAEVRGAGRPAILVLPDGVARLALLDVPPRTDAREFARFRLAGQLPYPIGEAAVDFLKLGRGRVLAAAVRRSVVQEYEQIAAGAGLAQQRVDLAPLAALAALPRQAASGVDVILGEAAFSIAVSGGGRVLAFRTRRRDPGPDEAERLALELERAARLAETPLPGALRVVGPGARGLAEAWRMRGLSVERAEEQAFWAAALA